MSFSELSIWTFIMIFATLLASMLIASILKRFIPFLQKTLIPVSVLGGIILLIISTTVYFTVGDYLFNLPVYGDGSNGAATGMEVLEMITYHCLGIGFIASGMRSSKKKFTKQRAGEVFDSGVTTVNSYLIQAFVGLVITIIAVCAIKTPGMISAAGILLAFGFGQGTGQALNYGKIYENEHGFVGGSNFGLTIAALGFLVACIGGVIYINIMRKKGYIKIDSSSRRSQLSDYEDENEIPAVSSLDKMTVQVALALVIYAISFGIMYGLSALLPSLADTLFGFNFLIGVLLTLPAKAILNGLYKKGVVKKRIVNNYMMDRISGLAFDLMIVAGVAAIQLPLLAEYWGVLLLLALFGTVLTFFYVNFVCKKLFPSYRHEQFLAFFGMLTGTASTGMTAARSGRQLPHPRKRKPCLSAAPSHRVRFPAHVPRALCRDQRFGGDHHLHYCRCLFHRFQHSALPQKYLQKTVCPRRSETRRRQCTGFRKRSGFGHGCRFRRARLFRRVGQCRR